MFKSTFETFQEKLFSADNMNPFSCNNDFLIFKLEPIKWKKFQSSHMPI